MKSALKEILLEQASSKRARPREEIVTALFELLEKGYIRKGDPGRVPKRGARKAR